jgi:hypothetical protein
MFGQNDKVFSKLRVEAETLFTAKEYRQAGQKYSQALDAVDLKTPVPRTRYKAGIAWALAGDKEQAFKYLNQLVQKDYYTDFKELSLETNFSALHKDKRWGEIKELIKENINEIEALIPFYQGMRWEDFDLEELEKAHLPLDGKTACMIPYRLDEGYGFVLKDKSDKWLIKPIYRQVFAVHEEGAVVLDSFGEYSVVKPDGTVLIPPFRQQISKEGNLYHTTRRGDCNVSPSGIPIKRFGENEIYIYCVINDFYDTKGTLLFTEEAHDFQTFIGDDQLAWFRYGKRYRIRNKSGELVKEFEYENHQNTFVGISDDLLIYSVTNEQDSTTHYVAKDLNGKVKFKLLTEYDKPTSFSGIYNDRGVRGVYQLSENLYGVRRKLDYETPYIFCDSLGTESVRVKWNPYNIGQMELDYFSEKEFIITSDERTEQFVINRQGDTILPKLIPIGDTTILAKYSKITRRENGGYICGWGSRGVHQFDENGTFIEKKSNRIRFEAKIIPWSQETLDALNEEYERRGSYRYSPVESFYKMLEYYSLNVPKNPTEGLSPIARNVIMPTDTAENGEVRYTSTGVCVSYINLEGELALELPLDIEFAGYFSEGLAPAMDNKNGLGFINLKGEWAIPPKYEIAWVGGYPISLPDFPTFRGGYAYLRGFKGYVDKNGKEFFAGKRMQDHYNHSH